MMIPTTHNDRAAVAAALLGGAWHDLPDLVRAACADFVDVLLATPAGVDWSDVACEAADAACPIYYDDLLALLADPVGGYWLDGVDDGDHVEKGPASFVQHVCTMVSGLFVRGTADLFGRMVDELVHADGFEAFELTSAGSEIARGLWSDWAGTVAELLAAAEALEGVAA